AGVGAWWCTRHPAATQGEILRGRWAGVQGEETPLHGLCLVGQRVSETARVRQRSPRNADERPRLVLCAAGANAEMHVWTDGAPVRGVTAARGGRVDGHVTGVDQGLVPSLHTWGLKRRNSWKNG
ncbi:unnamed protein product, partial [Gulo gulo]